MSVYLIAQITVTDPERYAKYASQTVALAETFGGRFLVKAGAYKQVEGSGPDRHVVVEFADMAAAEAFYNSPEYQAILPHALAGSKRNLVLVEGV